jgi:hypothetical protein
MLSFCDSLLIVTLEGWQESIGLQDELEQAKKLGKQIAFIDPYTFEITQDVKVIDVQGD